MKFDIIITATKLLAFILLMVGVGAGIYLKDSNIILSAIGSFGLILGVNTYAVNRTRQNETTTSNDLKNIEGCG